MEPIKCHGIMDCYGIESFERYRPKFVVAFTLRANANRQRHAIYYIVYLTQHEIEKTEKLIYDKKYEDACIFIKSIKTLKVPPTYKNSLELIPNKKLDPYESG